MTQPFGDHPLASLNGAGPVALVGVAQRRDVAAAFHDEIRIALQPLFEARILAHFRMELQRQHIAAAPEALLRVDVAGCQQFGVFGEGERVAVPSEGPARR